MTQFEQFLIEKGYIKFIFNGKTMKYEETKGHNISTMSNIDHRYIHYSDLSFLDKIKIGRSVMDSEFTIEDRRNEICFGLHEVGKPPTLIYPRPNIEIKRIKNGKVVTETQQRDDAMNVVLKMIPNEEILKAMFDKSKVIKIDLNE